jgi:hypothetical protein
MRVPAEYPARSSWRFYTHTFAIALNYLFVDYGRVSDDEFFFGRVRDAPTIPPGAEIIYWNIPKYTIM